MFEDSHGSRYTGDWKDGKMHGEGVCETVEGESTSEEDGEASSVLPDALYLQDTVEATSKEFLMGEGNINSRMV